MDATHRVIGIFQTQINGHWGEQTINITVYAFDFADAVARVFDLLATQAREHDPLALVRWYNPNGPCVYDLTYYR